MSVIDMIVGKKEFCNECGIRLGEGVEGRVEFNDGLYCKKCSENRRQQKRESHRIFGSRDDKDFIEKESGVWK